jgi:ABC-type multidrug transport system fused ATPase/permease subunit
MGAQIFVKTHLFRAFFLFPFVGLMLFAMSTASKLYQNYTAHVFRQQEGLWLFTQCKQADFLRKLSQHSDACQKINLLFAQTPFSMAVDEVIVQPMFLQLFLRLDWAFTISALTLVISVVYILTPFYLALMERRERDRLAFHRLDLETRKKTDHNESQTNKRYIFRAEDQTGTCFLARESAPKLRWRVSHSSA